MCSVVAASRTVGCPCLFLPRKNLPAMPALSAYKVPSTTLQQGCRVARSGAQHSAAQTGMHDLYTEPTLLAAVVLALECSSGLYARRADVVGQPTPSFFGAPPAGESEHQSAAEP
jgi:hypothetical protein